MTTKRRAARSNDPDLTVAGLKLKRVSAGHYEHVNRATGTTWIVLHDYGELRGVNRWIYHRIDVDAWMNRRESQAQDVYASKRDACEALVDRLQNRRT